MPSNKRKQPDTTSSDSDLSPENSSTLPSVASLSRQSSRQATNITRRVTEKSTPARVKAEADRSPTSIRSASKSQKVTTTVGNPYGEIIYVKVGPERTRFGIHQTFITRCSSFFRRVFEGKISIKIESGADYDLTKSNGSKILHLPKDTPEIFERFNLWLYGGKITTPEENETDLSWDVIFEVYIFAVHREIPGLQNSAIDASIEKNMAGKTLPSASNINKLYANGVRAANFRGFFLDLFTASGCDLAEAMKTNHYNVQFLGALVTILERLRVEAEDKVRMLKRKRDSVTSEEVVGESGMVNALKLKDKYYIHGTDNPIAIE